MSDDEIKLEETPKAKPKQAKVALTPEQLASRKQAHDIKVVTFLSGGKSW